MVFLFMISDKEFTRTSLIAQLVKNPPAIQETLVLFLGWEDSLEKGESIYSSILGLPLWLSPQAHCWTGILVLIL